MKTIFSLSENLINQIAAGEVIENPASVVKELVENALDAGAQHIHVVIESGGLDKILVIDDGIGMAKEDLQSCILRHATSKICYFEDLYDLDTMGFRGEALASIASCATVKIQSKHTSESHGNEILVKEGKILSVSPCAIAKGTKIEVTNLFANLPARKKFQKKALANIYAITRTMYHLALSNFSVGFTLISNDRKVLEFFPIEQEDNFQVRVKQILKIQEGRVWKSKDSVSLGWGFFAEPYLCKKTRASQFLFVNGRWIYSNKIMKAVLEGYGTRIQEGMFPPFYLHLTLPKDQIDVNVHPQKKEIRFLQLPELSTQITEIVHELFVQTKDPIFIQEAPKVTLNFEKIPYKTPIIQMREPESFIQMEIPQEIPQEEEKILSLVGNFALVEGNRGLFLIDLKKAWASCLYKKLEKEQTLATETLLLPIAVEVPIEKMPLLLSHTKSLQECGFSFHEIGKTTILVETIPKLLNESEVISFFDEVCQDLTHLEFSNTLRKKTQKNLAWVCERMAMKKNWTKEDAQYVLKKWNEYEQIPLSPKGKKIAITFHPEILDQLFEKCNVF